MKKIVLSMVAIAGLTVGASANEIIVDNNGNIHDVGIVAGFEHIGDSNTDMYSIGINNVIDLRKCELDVYVQGTVAYAPSQNDMSSATFFNIGAGVISPSVNIWNNNVELFAGLELQNEFHNNINDNWIVNLQPTVGLLINNSLTVSYKQYETDAGNSATLNISYKF